MPESSAKLGLCYTPSGRSMPPPFRRPFPRDFAIPCALGTITWLAIVVYWRWTGFSIYRGDLQGYIDWSHHLTRHTDYASHMPGYPFLLLAGRWITFQLLPDTFVAQCLGCLTWIVGLSLAYLVLKQIAPAAMRPGLLLFGLFPLLGVWSAADPTADLLAYAVFLAAMVFALENRFAAFACAAGAGLMIHQAFYPAYAVLALACVLRGMRWRYVVACGIPFALYYAAVAVEKNNINWILSFHMAAHTPKSGELPIFSGLIGTFFRGGSKYVLKAAILIGAFAASVALSIYCAVRRNWLLLSLCLPAVLTGIFSTQHVVWVVFRLSKLLLFPACLWLCKHPRIIRLLERPPVYALLALLLTASQLFWAHYSIVYAQWMPD